MTVSEKHSETKKRKPEELWEDYRAKYTITFDFRFPLQSGRCLCFYGFLCFIRL